MPKKALGTTLRGYKMGTLAGDGLKCHKTILTLIIFCYLRLDPKGVSIENSSKANEDSCMAIFSLNTRSDY